MHSTHLQFMHWTSIKISARALDWIISLITRLTHWHIINVPGHWVFSKGVWHDVCQIMYGQTLMHIDWKVWEGCLLEEDHLLEIYGILSYYTVWNGYFIYLQDPGTKWIIQRTRGQVTTDCIHCCTYVSCLWKDCSVYLQNNESSVTTDFKVLYFFVLHLRSVFRDLYESPKKHRGERDRRHS